MVANLNTAVIYCRLLTVEKVSTAINYPSSFITLTQGACTLKLITAVIHRFP